MIKLLVKNRLLGFVSGMMRKEEGKRKRVVLFAVLFAVLFLSLLTVSLSVALSLGAVLIPAGVSWLYFAIFILAELTVLFVLSIFETKSELFDCKDNDLLLSMPVKSSALLASRLIVVLIMNYAIEAVVFIPAVVIYAAFSVDIVGTLGFASVSLFIPPLATSLASGVGYLIAILMKKTRGSTVFTMLAYIAFLVLYFVGYTALIDGMDDFLLSFDPTFVEGKLPALEFIGNAASFKPLPFIMFIAISIIVSFVACFLMSRSYVKLLGMNVSRTKSAYRVGKIRPSNALGALTKKELIKFSSSATYMMNGGIGLIFLLVAAVAAAFNSDSLKYYSEYIFPFYKSEQTLSCIFASAITVLLSTVLISAASLSLEGRSLSVLKSLPVEDKTVLLSKLLPSVIICVPPTLVSSIILAFVIGSPIAYLPFIILTPLVAIVAFSALGLVFNVLFPNFDYQSEAQPIKQSIAVTLTMFSQLLISLVSCGMALALLYFIGPIVASLCVLGFYICLAIIFLLVLFIPMKKRYGRITA